jgi:hypothetical protein
VDGGTDESCCGYQMRTTFRDFWGMRLGGDDDDDGMVEVRGGCKASPHVCKSGGQEINN